MANRDHDPKKTHEIALSGLLFALAMALSFLEGMSSASTAQAARTFCMACGSKALSRRPERQFIRTSSFQLSKNSNASVLFLPKFLLFHCPTWFLFPL